jgi:hypothetical protein
MNRQNKILLIIFCFICLSTLALGIYFFPEENSPPLPQNSVTETPLMAENKKPDPQAPENTRRFSAAAPLEATQPLITEKRNQDATETEPYVFFPKDLMALLDIDMDELEKGRDAFKNTVIHVGWMDRVNEVLAGLDPVKKAAIVKNHTTLLYVKDKLNEAYLTGKIDHETFKKAIADLMKWHQHTYEAILNTAEYETLFEISPDLVDETIDQLIGQTPEYSFILNQNILIEDVKAQVQEEKLEAVDSHFKKMILTRDQIGKQINAGKMTLEQAREAMAESQQEFIARCKEILTEAEINIIFGSVQALETGASQTEAPAVLGDTDKIELGFKIENPETSIQQVKDKVDPAKLADVEFFFQERETERENLINRLDNREITYEELENISREMDAAFEENCRAILTDEEYQLIFGNPDDPLPVEAPAKDPSTSPQPMEEDAPSE